MLDRILETQLSVVVFPPNHSINKYHLALSRYWFLEVLGQRLQYDLVFVLAVVKFLVILSYFQTLPRSFVLLDFALLVINLVFVSLAFSLQPLFQLRKKTKSMNRKIKSAWSNNTKIPHHWTRQINRTSSKSSSKFRTFSRLAATSTKRFKFDNLEIPSFSFERASSSVTFLSSWRSLRIISAFSFPSMSFDDFFSDFVLSVSNSNFMFCNCSIDETRSHKQKSQGKIS